MELFRVNAAPDTVYNAYRRVITPSLSVRIPSDPLSKRRVSKPMSLDSDFDFAPQIYASPTSYERVATAEAADARLELPDDRTTYVKHFGRVSTCLGAFATTFTKCLPVLERVIPSLKE